MNDFTQLPHELTMVDGPINTAPYKKQVPPALQVDLHNQVHYLMDATNMDIETRISRVINDNPWLVDYDTEFLQTVDRTRLLDKARESNSQSTKAINKLQAADRRSAGLPTYWATAEQKLRAITIVLTTNSKGTAAFCKVAYEDKLDDPEIWAERIAAKSGGAEFASIIERVSNTDEFSVLKLHGQATATRLSGYRRGGMAGHLTQLGKDFRLAISVAALEEDVAYLKLGKANAERRLSVLEHEVGTLKQRMATVEQATSWQVTAITMREQGATTAEISKHIGMNTNTINTGIRRYKAKLGG